VNSTTSPTTAKQQHEQFENKLSSYEIDSKYVETIKEVMIYTYDSATKEIRENEANVKKQMSLLKSKIATIEERFAIGEIDNAIYQKFKTKYGEEQESFQSNLIKSTITSSNLQTAIDKALKMSTNLTELWVSGDLPEKKKIQNLVFPSGIGYDKLKGKVRTKRINSIFSSIPLLSRDLAKIKSGESVDFNQFSARVTL
jgi:site-specific DNA recombinase